MQYCLGLSVSSKKAELLAMGKSESASYSLKMCKRRQTKFSQMIIKLDNLTLCLSVY